MLLKMKVLYCPKLPQRPKFPHLTVICFDKKKGALVGNYVGIRSLDQFIVRSSEILQAVCCCRAPVAHRETCPLNFS